MAVEVEESPPHPTASSVHLQCCKYCFPCVQGLAKVEKGDESDFPFPPSLGDQLLGGSVASGSSGAPQQNIEPGAELVSQHQLGWHHWICPSSGLSGSLALFFGNVVPVGSLALVASVLWPWRDGCGSGVAVTVHVGNVYSSKQYFPLHNYILKSSHPSKSFCFKEPGRAGKFSDQQCPPMTFLAWLCSAVSVGKHR